jgi:undecaprenyl-diphosphatase
VIFTPLALGFVADMNLFQILILAVIQGLAELLPVSSSAHVIVAAKLMGLNATSPEMTLLLVMLHTGTMFAVILYFWRAWKTQFFASWDVLKSQAVLLIAATLLTGVVGGPLILGIPKVMEESGYLVKDAATGRVPKAEIEMLFGNLALIAVALAAGGALILTAGLIERKATRKDSPAGQAMPAAGTLTAGGVLRSTSRCTKKRARSRNSQDIEIRQAAWIGAVQGLCLPFRGFSRSGATISVGLLLGALKARAEEFSFALAVIITPAAIAKEVHRLMKASHEAGSPGVSWGMFFPSLLGMVAAFGAGLLALRWLSRWLEGGRWYLFGIYCLVASVIVLALHFAGY